MVTRQRSLFIILMIVLIWIISASVWAETIRLKNGRIFDGEIAAENGREVKIIMKSGIVTFSRDEIASIGDRKISEKDLKEAVKTLSAPALAKKPVAKKTIKSAAGASKPARKKEHKTVAKIKKQGPDGKAAQSAVLPAVAADTATATDLSASTVTTFSISSTPASSTALPVKPQKGLSPTAKAVIITVAISIIALIVFMIKQIKRKPKDIC